MFYKITVLIDNENSHTNGSVTTTGGELYLRKDWVPNSPTKRVKVPRGNEDKVQNETTGITK